MVGCLNLLVIAAGLAMAGPVRDHDKRQLGLPPLPIVSNLLPLGAFTSTSGFTSVIQLPGAVFTSFRVITQEIVYTVPAATTIIGAEGAGGAPAPAPTPAPSAGPGPGLGVIGDLVSDLLPIEVIASVTAPIADLAATVCLGAFINGACQETIVSNVPGAAPTAPGGLLGLPISLPGIEVLATLAATIVPSDLGIPIDPIPVEVALCLGIFTDGVCYTSDAAAAPQPTAAAPLDLPGLGLSASLCVGIFRDGLCYSAAEAATSAIVNVVVTTDPAAAAAIPTAVIASLTAIAVPAPSVATGAAAVTSAAIPFITSVLLNPGGVFTVSSVVTVPIEGVIGEVTTILDVDGSVSQVVDGAGSIISGATGIVGGGGSAASFTTAVSGAGSAQVSSVVTSILPGSGGISLPSAIGGITSTFSAFQSVSSSGSFVSVSIIGGGSSANTAASGTSTSPLASATGQAVSQGGSGSSSASSVSGSIVGGGSSANTATSGPGPSLISATGQTVSQGGSATSSGAQVTGVSSAIGGLGSQSSTFGTFVFDPLSPTRTSVNSSGSSTQLTSNASTSRPAVFTGEAPTRGPRSTCYPAIVIGIFAALVMI